MVFQEVWNDFIRLENQEQPARQGSERTELFARWQCPNCPFIVQTLEHRAKRAKADACGYHYWKAETPCPNRRADDLRGKPKAKAKAPETEAVEANTDATRENTEVGRQQLEVLREQLGVQKEMVALEKARADREQARGDRWKRDAKRSCEGTGVSSPSSSDSDGERAAKRARGNAHHEAKGKTYGIVEGRRVAYTVLGESLGCEAPEEPESVDEVGHRLEKRAVDLLGQELIAKNLYSHNTRLNRELNLPTHAMPAEQLGAVRKLEKVARVAQTVSKGRKGGDSGDATGDAIVEMVEAKNAKVQTAAKILVRELPDGEVKDRLMRKIPHSGNDYDDAWHASGSSHV